MPNSLSSKLSTVSITFAVLWNVLLDQRDDLLRLEGLGDIFFGTSKPGLQSVEQTISSRNGDEGHLLKLWSGFEVLNDLVAIHSWQANINEGYVGDSSIGNAQDSECFEGVPITEHTVPLSFQANL